MLAFSVPSKRSALDPPRLSTSPSDITISFRRDANSVQRHCNVSVVFKELSIVSSEAQEASDVFIVFWLRPIHYRMSLMLLGVDALLVNNKAAKIDFLTSPGAFCSFGLETMFCP